MRTFHHAAFSTERLARERDLTVSVCLPTRDEAPTIGRIAGSLVELQERQVVDQVVVVDAASRDGTGEVAARAGAEVHDESALLPELGPVLGKGDAMWRALTVLTGDVVCYLDADSEDFGPHFALGVLGPILCEPAVRYVKAFYRRPFKTARAVAPDGGGRVTELTARPLINLFYPELAGFRQPLAGEIAARRTLLERLPFVSGYGVEIAQLIDAYRAVGPDGLAQVDLDVRQNRHQPLAELAQMAYEVLGAVMERLAREGRLDSAVLDDAGPLVLPRDDGVEERPVEAVERPPLLSLRAAV
ncbi:MAG: glucosyl-3-phosphoglycerate synthase [Actinobacteria bacterium]|nr:glucosyl-3-phosphoglycerate synthase [Actinomycetota bacterium]